MSHKARIAHSLADLEEELILTLKDEPILKGGRLNEEEGDVLQNEDVQRERETEHNVHIRSNLKTIADVSSSHLQAKLEGRSGLLPHYDDYSYKPESTKVENGVVRASAPAKAIALNHDYEQVKPEGVSAEYAPSRWKRPKNPRHASQALLAFLESTAEEDKELKEVDASAVMEESLSSIRKKRIMEVAAKQEVMSVPVMSEEEALLQLSIERSRKMPQRSSVLELIKEQDEDEPIDEKKVEIELNPVNHRPTEALRVGSSWQIKDVIKGTSSAMMVNLPSERLCKREEEAMPTSFAEVSAEELERMKKEVSFLDEGQLQMGITSTLQYLREHSLLNQEEQVGRATDRAGESNPSDRIKLEYRNASGKLMKPKEAFRYICATFHGEGPGANKIEKRKRKELEELRQKEKTNTDGTIFKMLQQHQQKTGECYMKMEFGGHQTS